MSSSVFLSMNTHLFAQVQSFVTLSFFELIITKLCDLLGKQLHSLCGVAEDDALREESVKLSATEFLHRQMRVSAEPQVYRMALFVSKSLMRLFRRISQGDSS